MSVKLSSKIKCKPLASLIDPRRVEKNPIYDEAPEIFLYGNDSDSLLDALKDSYILIQFNLYTQQGEPFWCPLALRPDRIESSTIKQNDMANFPSPPSSNSKNVSLPTPNLKIRVLREHPTVKISWSFEEEDTLKGQTGNQNLMEYKFDLAILRIKKQECFKLEKCQEWFIYENQGVSSFMLNTCIIRFLPFEIEEDLPIDIFFCLRVVEEGFYSHYSSPKKITISKNTVIAF